MKAEGVHWVALVTALATFPLLFIGGLVTSKGAGLAVPDWPTSFGYNMFLYPWSKMVGDIFYEHSHRLVASAVGFLTAILALLLWLHERRRWLRWLGVIALALVIVQGVIGGLRVVLRQETLAIVHACLAQAFFALSVSLAFFTSREGRERPREIGLPDAGPMRRLCVLTTGIIYFQGVLGAVVRYTGAALEAHVVFAVLVAFHVLLLYSRVLRFHSDQPKLSRPAGLLSAFLVVQLALGLGSFASKFTSWGATWSQSGVVPLTTTHVITGALMLVTSLILTLRFFWLATLPQSLSSEKFFSERVSS